MMALFSETPALRRNKTDPKMRIPYVAEGIKTGSITFSFFTLCDWPLSIQNQPRSFEASQRCHEQAQIQHKQNGHDDENDLRRIGSRH